MHAGALKIRLNAPPADGRANDVLQKFLAKLLFSFFNMLSIP
jgi:uncharacterized protein YggU (UPF0235/DUF167 family)